MSFFGVENFKIKKMVKSYSKKSKKMGTKLNKMGVYSTNSNSSSGNQENLGSGKSRGRTKTRPTL